MNLKQIFKGDYSDDVLELLQIQYDRLIVSQYEGEGGEVKIDPIEELPFPTQYENGAPRSWVLDKLGTDDFIAKHWQRLIDSPIRLVMVVHDTAGTFNAVTGLDKYEKKSWSGDNTGRGAADDHNHGHMVASCVAGDKGGEMGILRKLAKEGKVILVADKVMSKGSGSFSWIAKGYKRTVGLPYDENDMVVHISSFGALGVKTNATIDKTMKDGIAKGQVWLASSGNSGHDPSGKTRVGYPAINDDVIAVGAVKPNYARQSYSSTGEEVYSTSGSGVPCLTKEGRIQTAHGTSFSQPIQAAIVGLIALFLGRKITQDEAKKICREMSLDLGERGRDIFFGYGVIEGKTIKEWDGEEPEDPEEPEEPEEPTDPEEPEEPSYPKLPPYTLKVQLHDIKHTWKYSGESKLRRMKYKEMDISVTSDRPAGMMTELISKAVHDYMNRHFLLYPKDWHQPKIASSAQRMIDMHLTEKYGLTVHIDKVSVGNELGNPSNEEYFILEGDEINGWKEKPSDDFQGDMIAVSIV